jgi:hypothetical protein
MRISPIRIWASLTTMFHYRKEMTMADLKSIRLSAQEILEDDATSKGSSSRFTHIVGILVIAMCLVLAVSAMVFMKRDLETVIEVLVVSLTGGTALPYTVHKAIEAYRGGTNAPQDTPQGGPQ